MIALTADAVPRIPRGVRLHQDQARGRPVLLAPERAFELDDPAIAVLELVDGRRSIAEIAALLAARFAAPQAEIEADVVAMLAELMAKRVIEQVTP